MKTFKYIFAVTALGLSVASCNDLELEPKGLVYENVLLSSDNGVKKYLALAYQDLPIEDFNYYQGGGYGTVNKDGWHNGNRWEAQKNSPASASFEATGRCTSYGDSWGYWPYDRIRDINNMIEQLPNYESNYKEAEYNALLGEAHFLRAFYYFGIVKRYGGVPLVDKVLDPMAPAEENALPRSTEYDSWKFIYNDLKFAMENASDTKTDATRATRWAAAALMSRAMLYAGTTAKYGHYVGTTGEAVNAGLMVMNPTDAAEFFKYAYDACKFLQDAGFKLHDGSDKEKAYTEVFIDDQTGTEDIFVRQFGTDIETMSGTSLYHSWDDMVLPKGTGLAQNVGAAIQPVWELMGLYEMPAITDADGKPIRFNSVEEIWNNGEMEARCRANFFFPGMTESVSGEVIDIQAGYYKSYPGTAADGTEEVQGSVNDYTNAYRIRAAQPATMEGDLKVNGKYGLAEGTGDEGYTRTGAFIRKYVNYNAAASTRALHKSIQHWKVFRYGEILCNWAEAAYELGLETGNESLKVEAFQYVNELRRRAGATESQMVSNPENVALEACVFEIDENLQFIRDERARELCFENHRIYDLRRWRVADVMFQDGKYTHTLLPYYVVAEDKYIYLNEVEREGRKVTFDKKWYYEQIPGGAISTNANIIRNDGY